MKPVLGAASALLFAVAAGVALPAAAQTMLMPYENRPIAQPPGVPPPSEGPQPAYPTTAYPTTAYPTTAYPTTAYPTTAYPTTAYPTTAYPTAGYPTAGYPPAGYPTANRPPGPYLTQCKEVRMLQGTLTAFCPKPDGTWHTTQLAQAAACPAGVEDRGGALVCAAAPEVGSSMPPQSYGSAYGGIYSPPAGGPSQSGFTSSSAARAARPPGY
jgi:hypothetical protein